MSAGYFSDVLEARVRSQAGDRCGYCLSNQRYVLGLLKIEHIVPKAKGGTDDESNLWLACRLCNGYEATQSHDWDMNTRRRIALFNPRRQRWSRHFAWSDDGSQIIGHTACGRAKVMALRLNDLIAVKSGREWVAADWHPPTA